MNEDRKHPVVVSYVATFLPREMLHVYRQIGAVKGYENWVLTRRRENARLFPYKRAHALRRHPLRFLRGIKRLWSTEAKRLSRHECSQMLAFCSHVRADLVHVYLGTEAARALPFLRALKRPKVVSFHGADTSQAVSDKDLAAIAEIADSILARSESLKQVLVARGVPADKIRIHRAGVPLPQPFAVRKKPDIDRDRPLRVFQACRFLPKKGLDVTVRAVSLLWQRGLPVQLTLAGEGPGVDSLLSLIRELGLDGYVAFPGFMSEAELMRLMAAQDVFVHPSRTTADGDREGIPNALLEAMAHGLPSISTRHSGIPEAIEDQISGILIDKAAPQALAQAMETLLAESALYERLSLGGHTRVRDFFSIEACARCLEASYDAVLKSVSL